MARRGVRPHIEALTGAVSSAAMARLAAAAMASDRHAVSGRAANHGRGRSRRRYVGMPTISTGMGLCAASTSAMALPMPPASRCSSAVTTAPVSAAHFADQGRVEGFDGVDVDDPGGQPSGSKAIAACVERLTRCAIGEDGHVFALATRTPSPI